MRKDTCVHFAGTMAEACEAGVNLDGLAGPSPGRLARLPCSGGFPRKEGVVVVECPHKRLPTPEEVAEDEEWVARRVEMMKKSAAFFAKVRAMHRGESASGLNDCPACGQPKALRWRISGYNGHIHAACKTEDCISFME